MGLPFPRSGQNARTHKQSDQETRLNRTITRYRRRHQEQHEAYNRLMHNHLASSLQNHRTRLLTGLLFIAFTIQSLNSRNTQAAVDLFYHAQLLDPNDNIRRTAFFYNPLSFRYFPSARDSTASERGTFPNPSHLEMVNDEGETPPGSHLQHAANAAESNQQNEANEQNAALHAFDAVVQRHPNQMEASQTRLTHIFCHNRPPENPEQSAFVYGIRAILSEGGPLMTGDTFMDSIRDIFPAGRLFHPNILANTEYYSRLRKVLEAYGVTLVEPDDTRRLNSRRIARTLYRGDEWADELTIALQLIERNRRFNPIQEHTPPIPTPSRSYMPSPTPAPHRSQPLHRHTHQQIHVSTGPSPPSHNPAQAVFAKYRDASSRYSGDICESWPEVRDEYDATADAFNLNESQKLQLLPAILKGDARRYFNENIRNLFTTYKDALLAISAHFNDLPHQHRLKNYLLGLKVDKFAVQGTGMRDALVKVSSEIKKFFPQVPVSYQCEDNRIAILKNAVLGKPWASSPISELHKAGTTYHSFYSNLANNLQNWMDEQRALGNDPQPQSTNNQPSSIFWQAKLGRHQHSSRPIFTRDRNLTCYSCGKKGHRAAACRSPSTPWDARRIAARQVRRYNTDANRSPTDRHGFQKVLYELAEDITTLFAEFLSPAETDTADEDIEVMFESMFDTSSEYDMSQDDISIIFELGTDAPVTHESLDVTHSETTLQSIIDQSAQTASEHLQSTPVDDDLEFAGVHHTSPPLGTDASTNDTFLITLDISSNSEATDQPHGILVSEDMSNTPPFWGACIDTGAVRCVIGQPQARIYCHQTGLSFTTTPSNTLFRFGSGKTQSLGTIEIRIPMHDRFLVRNIDVVPVDIPLLIGLDLLDQYRLTPDTVNNKLLSHAEGWSVPLVRKRGHLYYEWSFPQVLFTRTELSRLHQHFFHPTAQKLFNLIRRASPQDCTPGTYQLLQDIQRSCNTCQVFRPKPITFQVAMPEENIVFNEELSLDLFWLDGKPALHVVDIGTGFGNSCFITGQSVDAVWNAFVTCWATVYPGHPNKMRVDQGSNFTGVRWQKHTDQAGIVLKLSGVESHNSLGLGERYHAPLRRIYNKIRHSSPQTAPDMALRLAQKAMIDTVGPDGLVTSLLVFGIMPRLPVVNPQLPDQVTRMRALNIARTEMATIVAEQRISQALKSRIPPAANYIINPGDPIRVYREGDKKFLGPFNVVEIQDKQVYVDHNGRRVQYNIAQVIPENIFNGTRHLTNLHQAVRPLRQPPQPHDFLLFSENTEGMPAFITEVLAPGDPRSHSAEFHAAKQKEIKGLASRGIWQIVNQEDVPPNANILNGRFVLSIKEVETDHPLYKARYVVQGHRDIEKDMLVHSSTTMKQHSIRLVTAVAMLFGYKLWSCDVTQAYLQSEDALMRDVYLRPSKEFNLADNQLVKLVKPLYGLSDSGDYWHATLTRHLENELGLTKAVGDMSLFYLRQNNRLSGITGTYVDDTIHTGDDAFLNLCQKTARRFESKDLERDHFIFAGIEIVTQEQHILLHQRKGADKLNILPKEATYRDFKSRLMELGWITHTRPDICCAVAQLAQVTESSFTSESVKTLNKAIRCVKAEPSRGLQQVALDINPLHIRAYSDGSFANNPDSSSQLGYIILLCDGDNKCSVLQYRSFKSKRVVRSVLGAEVYAFADAFDCAFTLKTDLDRMLGRTISLSMMTDSKSLFDVIVKSSYTTERRLMIDLEAAREAYAKHEISDIGFIRSQHNPADAFTKIGSCDALELAIVENSVAHPVDQWVLRTQLTHSTSQTA